MSLALKVLAFPVCGKRLRSAFRKPSKGGQGGANSTGVRISMTWPGDNRKRNFLAVLRVSLRSGAKVVPKNLRFPYPQKIWNTLVYILLNRYYIDQEVKNSMFIYLLLILCVTSAFSLLTAVMIGWWKKRKFFGKVFMLKYVSHCAYLGKYLGLRFWSNLT